MSCRINKAIAHNAKREIILSLLYKTINRQALASARIAAVVHWQALAVGCVSQPWPFVVDASALAAGARPAQSISGLPSAR